MYIATVYRLLVRTLLTRGRMILLLLLGLVGVGIGVAIGLSSTADHLDAGTRLVNSFALSLYAPVATLVFASACFGDLVDDSTLVYLWMRPAPRWKLAVAAYLATITITLPMVVIPMTGAAIAAAGGAGLVKGALLSTSVAVIAYSALFLLAGLWIRRALAWGLAYILLWEGFIAAAGRNASRLALRAYSRSLLHHETGVKLKLANLSAETSIIVPLVAAVVAVALTTWRLRETEVA
ncbi:MAG: hypothetical protein AB7L13_10330 [Acidimicrobiia bacterium]